MEENRGDSKLENNKPEDNKPGDNKLEGNKSEDNKPGISYLQGNENRLDYTAGAIADMLPFAETYGRNVERTLRELAAMSQTVKDSLGSLKEKLSKAEDISHPLQTERLETIEYIGSDADTLCTMVASVLTGYRDMAAMIDKLGDGGFQPAYVEHRRRELTGQSAGLNRLFAEVNRYIFAVYECFGKEEQALAMTCEQNRENEALHQELLGRYNGLLKARRGLNNLIEERMLVMQDILKSLREDMAKVHLNKLEQDVARRREEVQARQQQTMLEDVRDYEDLEGQYRHQYDEEGRHIGTEGGGDGSNRNGLLAIAAVAVAAAVIIGVFLLK